MLIQRFVWGLTLSLQFISAIAIAQQPENTFCLIRNNQPPLSPLIQEITPARIAQSNNEIEIVLKEDLHFKAQLGPTPYEEKYSYWSNEILNLSTGEQCHYVMDFNKHEYIGASPDKEFKIKREIHLIVDSRGGLGGAHFGVFQRDQSKRQKYLIFLKNSETNEPLTLACFGRPISSVEKTTPPQLCFSSASIDIRQLPQTENTDSENKTGGQ